MIELSRIDLGRNVYTYYYQARNPKTGKFAKNGDIDFNFEKLRRVSNTQGGSVYNVVKHSEMNPISVRAGKTISELIYRSRNPKIKLGAVAFLVALGTILAGGLSNRNKTQEVNTLNTSEPEPAVVVNDTLTQKVDTVADNTYVVKNNDNIWKISKNRLMQAGLKNPKNAEVNNLKNETIKMNPDIKDNGDLIYAGDTLILPPLSK